MLDERFDADGELVFRQRDFVLAAREPLDFFEDRVEAAGQGGLFFGAQGGRSATPRLRCRIVRRARGRLLP